MTAKKVKNSLKDIARRLLLGKVTNEDFYGWQFRKNKGPEDINHAIRKAVNPKNGFGKFEYELSMLETYLDDVLKHDRSVK